MEELLTRGASLAAALIDPLTWCSAIAVVFIMRPPSIWRAIGISIAINIVAGVLILALDTELPDAIWGLLLAAVATAIWTALLWVLRRLFAWRRA